MSTTEKLSNMESTEDINEISIEQDENDGSVQSESNDDDDDEQSGGEEEQSTASSNVAIDLSENEFYKGMCTLLEDQEGNNILEYISLLHSEFIGHNKTLKAIKKDLGVIAECAKKMVEKM